MPTSPALLARLKNNDDPDAQVLFRMAELGADLSLPHLPEFTFEAQAQPVVMALAKELAGLHFDVQVFAPEHGEPSWQVVASRRMVLDLDAVIELSAKFETLAHSHGASYDGWGASVES
ncbi:Regulator of ribonuclease activity B [Roseateles sp. YR242]|uniref:ribonuclease E inhibitor RraB n=1 Tax=Roseateles sp. YR242 TaxID=1855305 RepID=UPI0008D543E2|nr:ribonuclease E inhibitor RraB [Roseateles sp. YR242]SEL90796.1 Regulator of ribonuclease activity B [Roseateles sp. YR242]